MKPDGHGIREITELVLKEEKEEMKREQWGIWTLDREHLTLDYKHYYWIPLKNIHSSAQMLDWIFQIHNKTWNDGKVISDLIAAFQDLFHPQGTLCSCGEDRRIDSPELMLRRRIGRTAPSRSDSDGSSIVEGMKWISTADVDDEEGI